jgi:hypothetical protein
MVGSDVGQKRNNTRTQSNPHKRLVPNLRFSFGNKSFIGSFYGNECGVRNTLPAPTSVANVLEFDIADTWPF